MLLFVTQAIMLNTWLQLLLKGKLLLKKMGWGGGKFLRKTFYVACCLVFVYNPKEALTPTNACELDKNERKGKETCTHVQ